MSGRSDVSDDKQSPLDVRHSGSLGAGLQQSTDVGSRRRSVEEVLPDLRELAVNGRQTLKQYAAYLDAS